MTVTAGCGTLAGMATGTGRTRTHGSLIRWNDSRGVGAIAPADGGSSLFVHGSAFPRDGVQPRIGELLSYEIESGATGEPHATRIQRLGKHPRIPRSASSFWRTELPHMTRLLLGALIVACLAWLAFEWMQHPAANATAGGIAANMPLAAMPLLTVNR